MNERDAIDLSSDDRQLLDALIEADFDPAALEPLNETERQRVTALSSLFRLLDDDPIVSSEANLADHSLVEATMQRIEDYEAAQEERMKLPAEEAAPPIRQRTLLPNLATIAAMVLFGVSICLPLLSGGNGENDADFAANLRDGLPNEVTIDTTQTAGILNLTQILSGKTDDAAENDNDNSTVAENDEQPRWWLFSDGGYFTLMRRSSESMKRFVTEEKKSEDAIAYRVDIFISPEGVEQTDEPRLWLIVGDRMALIWNTSENISKLRDDANAIAFPVQIAPAR